MFFIRSLILLMFMIASLNFFSVNPMSKNINLDKNYGIIK